VDAQRVDSELLIRKSYDATPLAVVLRGSPAGTGDFSLRDPRTVVRCG
jgi:hypothetical protein